PSGIFMYLPAEDQSGPMWVDRGGRKISDLPIPAGNTLGVALSRNGDVLVTRWETQSAALGLWVVHGVDAQRIGSAPAGDVGAHWSPEGAYIYFARDKGLYRRRPIADAKEELLLPPGPDSVSLTTFTADGSTAYGVSYNAALQQQGFDIFRLDLRD